MTSPTAHSSPGTSVSALLAGFSADIRWAELGDLERVRALIPAGSRLHVGFADTGHMAMRLGALRVIGQSGFDPVAVVPARRLQSESMLREYLAGLREAGASALVVGGDPDQPQGPYPDAISVIRSGLLEEYGVRRAGVAGHPGGRTVAPDHVLWQALADKAAELERRALAGSVTTQFGFDADQVLAWLAQARERGVGLPVRIGVPGPAAARRLLWYASRCDVSISVAAARQYGISLSEPTGTAGPGRFIQALAAGYDARVHGEVTLHFFSFTGFAATVEWISGFRRSAGAAHGPAGDG